MKSWWTSFRYGSVFFREGRDLRRVMRDPLNDEYYSEVTNDDERTPLLRDTEGL